jgi:hypothetical protein
MIYRFLLCLVIFVGAIGCIAQAYAQGLEPLPAVQSLDVTTFAENSREVVKTFEEDPFLGFTIQLPNKLTIKKDENLKNVKRANNLYGEVFYAYSPAIRDRRAYLQIVSHQVDRLISARDWFVNRALEDGFTIHAIESDKKGDVYETLYVRLDQFGNSEIVRSRGYWHEDRIITVDYVLPNLMWQDERDYQTLTLKSFEFNEKYPVSAPEEMVNYEYLESFSMQYPKSWRMDVENTNAVNEAHYDFKTVDRDNFIFATATVSVISSGSLRDRIDQTIYPVSFVKIIEDKQQEIDELGFKADTVMEQRTYDLNFESTLQTTEIYPLRRKTSDTYVSYEENPIVREFWLTVIKTPEDKKKNYVLSMITPSRDENPYQWSLSAKFYENLVESLR